MSTLITGASSGIGTELARRFAGLGHDLVLVARRRDRLDELAAELERDHGATVTVVPLDLSTPTAPDELVQRLDALGLTVDVLVNNAGFATHGYVADADPGRLHEQIALNCQALVGLTARFLPGMRARGTGTILNIASTAAFQPVPHMAVYSATKAFVLTFTEALWHEMRGSGVRVLAACPGPTDTPFFEVAGMTTEGGRRRTTQQLADHIMRALRTTKPSVVDGLANALLARVATRLVPRRVVIAAAGRMMRPAAPRP
ncbi:MAG: SDR family oxidoreductase [Micrococcales bacterium]|nr:SDR family oxidoreductase [Micrococcales bacterium]